MPFPPVVWSPGVLFPRRGGAPAGRRPLPRRHRHGHHRLPRRALERPLLVEGPAGVGKTQLARAVSDATGAELIRLQCYEGLDEARALYEWNYRKQLLRIQATS